MTLNKTIREPLLLEDWPILYLIWWTFRGFRGAIFGHYLEPIKSLRGFGPSPSWWLKPSTLLQHWKISKSRMYSRFRFPTFQ